MSQWHSVRMSCWITMLLTYLLTYLPGAKRLGAKRPGANWRRGETSIKRRPSVCLWRWGILVTGRNTSKMISWPISLGCSLSTDPNNTRIYSKGSSWSPGVIETRGIVLLLIYSFTFTSAFTQCMQIAIEESLAVQANTVHRVVSLRQHGFLVFIHFCCRRYVPHCLI